MERIRSIDRKTKDTYAMSNNHHLGKAITNGLEIQALLTGKPVVAPESLRARYPDLNLFTEPAARCIQTRND